LELANRVHPRHRAERFSRYRHFILTFHDSTLEFIAEGFSVETLSGPLSKVIIDAASRLILPFEE